MGAEYFYGFFGAGVSQWYPPLWENTTPLRPPKTPEEGYHLEADMADKTVAWIQRQKSIHPEKPWIAYYAPNGHKPPVGVPSEYIKKYRGKFDDGYDKLRERILARQKELGIVPADTKLAPRPAALPPWDKLTDTDKKVGARWMEVFCGAVEYTDYQVGRIVEAIEQTGDLDNTLIIYIAGDNGPTPEGGLHGSMNKLSYFNGVPESLDDLAKQIDDFGGPKSHGSYPAAWAYATSTPFTYGKDGGLGRGQQHGHAVFSWPARIKDKGGIRRQFHHLIDVAPTILESAGVPEPKRVNGVDQMPMHGVSMLYTFDDAKAKDRRTTQYFELSGGRAIYHDGWWAGTRHGQDGVICCAAGTPFDKDVWELYDMRSDFGHATDLAAKNPEKLKELQALFDSEARRYNVYPMADDIKALLTAERPELVSGNKASYGPGTVRLPEDAVIEHQEPVVLARRRGRQPGRQRRRHARHPRRGDRRLRALGTEGQAHLPLQLPGTGAVHDHFPGAAAEGEEHGSLRLRLRRRRHGQGRHGHAVDQRQEGGRRPDRENGAGRVLDGRHVRCGGGLGHASVADLQAAVQVHRHTEEGDGGGHVIPERSLVAG